MTDYNLAQFDRCRECAASLADVPFSRKHGLTCPQCGQHYQLAPMPPLLSPQTKGKLRLFAVSAGILLLVWFAYWLIGG